MKYSNWKLKGFKIDSWSKVVVVNSTIILPWIMSVNEISLPFNFLYPFIGLSWSCLCNWWDVLKPILICLFLVVAEWWVFDVATILIGMWFLCCSDHIYLPYFDTINSLKCPRSWMWLVDIANRKPVKFPAKCFREALIQEEMWQRFMEELKKHIWTCEFNLFNSMLLRQSGYEN